ncbi:sulfotransferase [Actinopolymorpha alba]|uniref:sulfotransferase n=1 Tax=Actinopolymorpha alba TaxID=533267 RepID=UPI00192A702C|nr:sulfotransferase [Actinopolymorpha alba]
MSRTLGRYTSGGRLVPSFLLAGGQRCGTTSLHRALIAHPVVAGPVLHKGVNYFDLNYDRGPAWYRGHFPLLSTARRRAGNWSVGSGEPQAMESTGYYLYHPLALPRIARDLPGVRLIVMLRDPVERAYSAYKHAVARGFETESFERAQELEPERLAGEEERLASDPSYQSHAHRHFAYVERGRYSEQLRRVFDLLGRDRVHVLESEEFFTKPEDSYAEALEFLGLPSWLPSSFDQHNARPSEPMPGSVRRRLEEHFQPYDEELTNLLGRTPTWRR